MNEQQIADKLSYLSNVEIRFLKKTKQFYVDVNNVEIKNGLLLRSVACYADTPLKTLQLTLESFIKANLIVKNAYSCDREEYKWDGKKFEKLN